MIVEFIDLNLWQTQIKNNVTALRDVKEVTDFQKAVNTGLKRFPTAFIIPTKDNARPNTNSTGFNQKVISNFGVLIAVKHVGDNTGEAARQALLPIRNAIASALVNWTPDTQVYKPTEFRGGQLSSMVNGVIWWQDNYETTFYLG